VPAFWQLLVDLGADPVHTGPSERNLAAMQKALDAVPPHWTDANLPSVFWPKQAVEMWDADRPFLAG
jgi:hypothetical protein